jgi:3-isopropylmalate/(R)-2-methylmalate dehydratase small subunit
MDKFTKVTGPACPINQPNLNTDQILPARYLKWTRAMGIGKVLFNDLRFDAEGEEKPDFPINKPAWRDPKIVVGARNFGCGSSREAAVYALYDHGVRVVIAPSFGDIFSGNSIQNGLLLATVTDDEAAEIMETLERTPDQPITVDLEQQTIVCGNRSYHFTIDPVHRMRLLNGWDDIALTESYRDKISAFKTKDRSERPWAVPRPSVRAARSSSPGRPGGADGIGQ